MDFSVKRAKGRECRRRFHTQHNSQLMCVCWIGIKYTTMTNDVLKSICDACFFRRVEM